jgi:hypothetical protein
VDFRQALTFATHVAKRGAGHSAAFHGDDTDRLVAYSQEMPVYRVVVNAPCSQGAAGFSTHLAPSFTIGTGFAGRSSIGENVGPQHLVQWTKIAWNTEASPDLRVLNLASVSKCVPKSRHAAAMAEQSPPRSNEPDLTRDDLRRMILEELRSLQREGS